MACVEERPINDEVVDGEFCFSLNQTGIRAFDLWYLHPWSSNAAGSFVYIHAD